MKYSVMNCNGDKAEIEYICFGTLASIDSWYEQYGTAIKYHFADGRSVQGVLLDSSDIETDGDFSYVKGFRPNDLKTLTYIPPIDSEALVFLQHNEEILFHPLFKDVKYEMDESQIYFSISMDRKMDETLYPLFVLRNTLESESAIKLIKYAMEAGASPRIAFFLASAFYLFKGVRGDSFYLKCGDSAVLDNTNPIIFGDLVTWIKGDSPFVYSDLRWDQTNVGYSRYGCLPMPYYMSNEDDEDYYSDQESWDYENTTATHPITDNPYMITSASCFKRFEDYPDGLNRYLSAIPHQSPEDFISFVKEVVKYVQD